MEKLVFWVLLVSAMLYCVAAVGFFFQGKWELGVAYIGYALANVMFARL